MQTLAVVHTVRWLEAQLTKETKELVFSFQMLNVIGKTQAAPDSVKVAIRASHDLSKLAAKAAEDRDVTHVLTAFGLQQLCDPRFAEELAFQAAFVQTGPPGGCIPSAIQVYQDHGNRASAGYQPRSQKISP